MGWQVSILEAANAYVAETAPMKNGASPLEVMLRRAFMAGALEAARHDRHFFPQAAWMAPCIEVPRIACQMRIAP